MTVTVWFWWDFIGSLRGVREWAVYVSDSKASKGSQYGPRLALEPRKCRIDVEEGTWFARAIPVNERGDECADWRACPGAVIFATGREQTPAEPANVGAGLVDTGSRVEVQVDPVAMGEVDGRVEVVAVPAGFSHASQGRLVGEFPIERADLVMADASRSQGLAFGVESIATVRNLLFRVISPTGQPGPTIAKTLAMAERPGSSTTIASISSADGSHPGFPSVPSVEAFEYGAGYGARLLALPDWTDIDDWFADVLPGLERISPFATNAIVRTNELDLGSIKRFILEIADEVHRETQLGAYDTENACAIFASASLSPTDVPEIRRSAESGTWQFRELFADGTPRRAIRPENARWVYWAGDTSPISTDEDDAILYVPGAYVRARYVIAELRLREPCGMHRLQTGNVRIRAREFDRVAYPETVLSPRGLSLAPGTPTVAFATNVSFAVYLGRAPSDNPSIDLVTKVTTAVSAAPTWAEFAIAKGTPVANAGASLTTMGYTDVSTPAGSTGIIKVTVATSGVVKGDRLWAVFGSQAGTVFQLQAANADAVQSGVFVTKAATRPSTMAAASAFSLCGAAVLPPWAVGFCT